LVRLFALGLDVQAADLEGVPGAELSDWLVTGLANVRRGVVHPQVAIRPAQVWGEAAHLACDAPTPLRGQPPFKDFVRGVTRPSALLAKLTLRQQFHRALDMGTGEGVQAILAARHCDQVVATDINPRALAFARFNLAWNGIENVELREGDRSEPVRGEEFDLIVSNPPYVISPSKSATFRDSGLPTDTITGTTVAEAAKHLASGGWAFVLGQWALQEGERWQDRVERWVVDIGCDALAMQQQVADPVTHAARELSELGGTDPKKADQQFEEWLRYFDAEGIVAIGTGFVVLRRTDGKPWCRTEELQQEPADNGGVGIAALFSAQDWLSEHTRPGEVLAARWRSAEDVRLDITLDATAQHWAASRHVVRHSAGLRTSVEITQDLSELVRACDGVRPLRTIFDDHWKVRGRRPSSWHEEAFEGKFRRLVAEGLLVPAE
jgi:methylase of polypeptide subunit release factors